MSSAKESIPNDITTQKATPTDVETDSQVSGGTGRRGWLSARNLIILGVAAVASLILVGVILFLTLPSSSEVESPRAEALIGVTTTTEKSGDFQSSKVTPSGPMGSTKPLTSSDSNVTPSGSIVTSSNPQSYTSNNVTNSPSDPRKTSQLIFAQVLFRHGARAPSSKLRRKEEKYFPRGRGELTDRGFKNSYLIGLFLKKRYVDSGFLTADMVPAEMKWYSRRMSRLLSTASTVGAAMFRNSSQKYVSVPIVTKSSGKDHLLNFPLGSDSCEVIRNYYNRTCPEMLDSEEEEEFLTGIKCLLGKIPPVFEKFDINDSDKLINMVRNNVPVPKKVTENIKAISEEYMKVRHYKNGIGEPSVIQVRFGVLVDTLLKDIRKAWKEHLANNQTLKFKVYSTQDWVMSGVLDAFGVHHHLLTNGPQEEPNYNVMILIELWKNENGEAYVKFLYKPEEVTEEDHVMMDLTKFVPGCEGMEECPRKKFNKCCDATRINVKNQEKACYPNGKPKRKPRKP